MRGEYEEKLSHEILILLFLSLSVYLPKLLFLVCSRQTQKKTLKKSDFNDNLTIFCYKSLNMPHTMVLRHWQIVEMNITYQNGWARWSHLRLPDVNIRFFRTFFAYLHSWLSLNFFFWCELANIELKKKRKVRCFAMLIRKCVIYLHDEFKLNIENLKCS